MSDIQFTCVNTT